MAWGVEMAWDCRVDQLRGLVIRDDWGLWVLGKVCSCGCEAPGKEGRMGRKEGTYVWSRCCSCKRYISQSLQLSCGDDCVGGAYVDRRLL